MQKRNGGRSATPVSNFPVFKGKIRGERENTKAEERAEMEATKVINMRLLDKGFELKLHLMRLNGNPGRLDHVVSLLHSPKAPCPLFKRYRTRFEQVIRRV